jgi:hypothetical protein
VALLLLDQRNFRPVPKEVSNRLSLAEHAPFQLKLNFCSAISPQGNIVKVAVFISSE